MLSDAIIEQILARAPAVRIGVLGDLFLDRYLDLDADLTEPSLETGLDAYQVVQVRALPGAAGTIINNLAALAVGQIVPVAIVGDDGEGYELRQALGAMPAVDASHVMSWPGRRTPTYTKPMLRRRGEPARELNRLDIKNRTATPIPAESAILTALDLVWQRVDALLVLDQVTEVDCGVVTARVREHLAELGSREPEKFVLADSRERIELFRGICIKPNQREGRDLESLRRNCARTVFLTTGETGMQLLPSGRSAPVHVPAYPVTGPIDPVGAGDSVSAAIATAVACGASLEQAAAFGNLVASITIQQVGTTGIAPPALVRARWREVQR